MNELRKQKKAEWKRKMAIKQERDKILQQIDAKIINNAVKIDNALDGEFADVNGDDKKTPIQSLFGGVIG